MPISKKFDASYQQKASVNISENLGKEAALPAFNH